MTKVFVVLTAVLAIAMSCMFISAAAQWDNWRTLAQEYQMQRDAEITQRMNIRASMEAALAMKDDELARVNTVLGEAQGSIKDLTDSNAKLKSDLARAQQEALAFDAARTKLQEILAVATNERTALQKHNQTLLDQNNDLQTRNTRLNSRTLELTANVTVLTEEVRNLQEKNLAYERQISEIHRGGAIRSTAAPPSEAGGARAIAPAVAGRIGGRVAALDGPYASIDVGETSGVSPGMTFMVHRDGIGYIGDLVIDTVRPKEAGGKLVLAQGRTVQVGDWAEYGRNP